MKLNLFMVYDDLSIVFNDFMNIMILKFRIYLDCIFKFNDVFLEYKDVLYVLYIYVLICMI